MQEPMRPEAGFGSAVRKCDSVICLDLYVFKRTSVAEGLSRGLLPDTSFPADENARYLQREFYLLLFEKRIIIGRAFLWTYCTFLLSTTTLRVEAYHVTV